MIRRRLDARRRTQDTGKKRRGGLGRLAPVLTLASCILSLVSAVPARAEEQVPPVLTAVTAERTEKGVRLHLQVDGEMPEMQEHAFAGSAQVLLQPQGLLLTSLAEEVSVDSEWVKGVRLYRDPTAPAALVPDGLHVVDLVVIVTDQPRSHWVLAAASEVVVDIEQPLNGASSAATMTDGREAASAVEMGLTEEELQGMLSHPSIPPLPQPPSVPAVPPPAPSAHGTSETQ